MVKIIATHPIGIIAGRGDLPKILIDNLLNRGQKFVIFLLESEEYANISYYNQFNPILISYGGVEQLISKLNFSNIKQLVFVGAVNKPNFQQMKVDKTATILLAKILANKILGDNAVLKTVINFLASRGFDVLAIEDLLDDLVVNAGVIGNIKPNKEQIDDINLGISAIKHFSKFDVGQAVVVAQKQIIAVEAIEGTDSMLERCSTIDLLKNQKAILVKMPKIRQNRKVDLPTIGLTTLEKCLIANINGIIIAKKQSLIICKAEVIDFANANNIFLQAY